MENKIIADPIQEEEFEFPGQDPDTKNQKRLWIHYSCEKNLRMKSGYQHDSLTVETTLWRVLGVGFVERRILIREYRVENTDPVTIHKLIPTAEARRIDARTSDEALSLLFKNWREKDDSFFKARTEAAIVNWKGKQYNVDVCHGEVFRKIDIFNERKHRETKLTLSPLGPGVLGTAETTDWIDGDDNIHGHAEPAVLYACFKDFKDAKPEARVFAVSAEGWWNLLGTAEIKWNPLIQEGKEVRK